MKHNMRYLLTIVLLVFVWRGHWWAVATLLTLQVVAMEFNFFLVRNPDFLKRKTGIHYDR